ncbi:hypothetical protein [Microvirga aerophila]|uniref:Uncharacterized protein n=1 Tax=Microvirga aerophila TaxID=670291 RepID=A0A512C2F3_9HYPH|nr:hypothetical protein [Microvirga aerophila]GEO18393.1 hypothetical protein MAE02_60890 [Microvirga aerophila]
MPNTENRFFTTEYEDGYGQLVMVTSHVNTTPKAYNGLWQVAQHHYESEDYKAMFIFAGTAGKSPTVREFNTLEHYNGIDPSTGDKGNFILHQNSHWDLAI